jgi:pSer/pThr/pTyr-binding forkhead associated (FHA) protein
VLVLGGADVGGLMQGSGVATPRLLLAGPGATAFDLGEKRFVVIGRAPECDVFISDQRISRRHALLQLVDDQHLLRDLGSSNGTFLNGLRVDEGHCFALREGDVIEVGAAKLVYARGAARARTREEAADKSGAHAIGDLVRDGYANLTPEQRTELQVSVQRAFDSGGRMHGLERSLREVESRVRSATVAVFLATEGRLRAVVARPTIETARGLLAISERAAATRQGRIHLRSSLRLENVPLGESSVIESFSSLAAVPLLRGEKLVGVLALHREVGGPVDRGDLALLAAIGDRIAITFAVQPRQPDDTQAGYGV